MTIQQIYYALTIAECGSMNKAAEKLFATQPTLTNAIKELEQELGISIFWRTYIGVIPTAEGVEFLSNVKSLYHQYQQIMEKYSESGSIRQKFSISMQHYSFAVKAFAQMAKHFDMNQFDFVIRETKTMNVIRDVGTLKSEIGILYVSDLNRKIIQKLLRQQELEFHTLIQCSAGVYLSQKHSFIFYRSVNE